MGAGADAGGVGQGAQGDVGVGAFADDGIEQAAAVLAAHIVGAFWLADDQQVVFALDELKALARNPGEGLEGSAGGAPALAAMAIQRVLEAVFNLVVDGATLALAAQQRGGCHRAGCCSVPVGRVAMQHVVRAAVRTPGFAIACDVEKHAWVACPERRIRLRTMERQVFGFDRDGQVLVSVLGH